MENEIIRFETFQVISFALASSLFLYFTVGFVKWFVRGIIIKARPGRR